MKGTAEKVAIAVQVGGKGYYVALPYERMVMLLQLAASLTDGGNLKLVPMPAGQELMEIKT